MALVIPPARRRPRRGGTFGWGAAAPRRWRGRPLLVAAEEGADEDEFPGRCQPLVGRIQNRGVGGRRAAKPPPVGATAPRRRQAGKTFSQRLLIGRWTAGKRLPRGSSSGAGHRPAPAMIGGTREGGGRRAGFSMNSDALDVALLTHLEKPLRGAWLPGLNTFFGSP